MTTIFTHPAVEKYLAELDAALVNAPAHAADLRDQVREHIEDALSPDASNTEVDDTLRRLGSPRELIADAGAGGELPQPVQRVYIRPWVWKWLARRRASWWVAAGLAVVLSVCAVTAWRIESDVARLQLNCETCGWFTAADADHSKYTQPDESDVPSNVQQFTVPLRVRQPQTFTYDVWNPSSLTQRLIGGSIPSGLTTEHLSLSFSTADPITTQGDTHQLSYRTNIAIPPHSTRVVRESWRRDCANGPGSSEVMEFVTLRVDTLRVTRRETLPLPAVFQTLGGPFPRRLMC